MTDAYSSLLIIDFLGPPFILCLVPPRQAEESWGVSPPGSKGPPPEVCEEVRYVAGVNLSVLLR